jgi:hypothetical protein
MSAVFVSSATAVPRHKTGGVVAYVLLAVVTLVLGLRAVRGFAIRLIPQDLELRSGFRTRRLPLARIDRFEPHVGSEGLIYRKAYVHIVMTDGNRVPCSAIQWAPSDEDACRAACNVLAEVLGTEAAA